MAGGGFPLPFIMKYLTGLFFLVVNTCYCQPGVNLIPNYSFEEIDSCPHDISRVYYAYPWKGVSVDLWAGCNEGTIWEGLSPLGNTAAGSQYPYDGLNHIGLYIYGNGIPTDPYIYGSGREVLSVKLPQELKKNKNYCFSFYESLSDFYKCATNNFDAYFSKEKILDTSIYGSENLIGYTPQFVYIGPPKTNDETWEQIKGRFKVDGGEKYMYFGNFHPLEQTDTIFFIQVT
jgi:hypothetical protein